MLSAPTLGSRSQECPEIVCYDTCTPCEHKQYVFDSSTNFNGKAEGFEQVVDAILSKHDDYVAALCSYQADICKRGELVNFPCVQCGFIDPACVILGEPLFLPEICAECPCFKPLDFSQCSVSSVDLSVAVPSIYGDIVGALEMLVGRFASGGAIETFFNQFLPDAALLFFKDSVYHFSLGNASNDVMSILPLLIDLAPVPIGASVQFYINCDEPSTDQNLGDFGIIGHFPEGVVDVNNLVGLPNGQVSGSIFVTFDVPVDLGSLPNTYTKDGLTLSISSWIRNSTNPAQVQGFANDIFTVGSNYSIDYTGATGSSGESLSGPAIFNWLPDEPLD